MTDFYYNHLPIYLFIALFLLVSGIAGLLYRRTLIGMLISMELVMNGAGLNLVALNRFAAADAASGMVFALIIMGIAAAEAALALGIIIVIYRRYRHVESAALEEMKN